MVEMAAPISLDGVAVHLDCWCIYLCYLYFAPENPEYGKMYLLVLAHPGCPGLSLESHKMVVVIVVVGQQKMSIFPPNLNSASTLPGKTIQKQKSHIFHLNDVLLHCQT